MEGRPARPVAAESCLLNVPVFLRPPKLTEMHRSERYFLECGFLNKHNPQIGEWAFA